MEASGTGTKSVVTTSLLLLSIGIGTGVLVLPKAMASVGYLTMGLLLAFGSMLSAFTTWILFMAVTGAHKRQKGDLNKELLSGVNTMFDDVTGICCSRRGLDQKGDLNKELNSTSSCSETGPTYSELLCEVTPPWAPVVLNLVLAIYGSGAMCTYFLFIAGFVQDFSFWPKEALGPNQTIALTACFVFPLTVFPTIGVLSRFAGMGLISLCLMTLGILIRAPEDAEHRDSPLLAVDDLDRMPAVLCICVYAFMWHTGCVPIARELENPTPSRCAACAIGGATLLFLVYALIAFAGYFSWGQKVIQSRSIVEMYSSDDSVFVGVRLALTVNLLIATPLNSYPVRESCVTLVRQCVPNYELTLPHRILWGGITVGCSAGLGVLFPQVTELITYLGGTLAALLMLIFPALISQMVFDRKTWLTVVVGLTLVSLYLLAAVFGVIGKQV